MATGKGNNYLIAIIIVAIIVIILAIAIPAYRSSQVHQHLNAAVDEAASAKLVVEEAATVHGGDVAQLSADDIHWNRQVTDDQYVSSIRVLDGGRIRVATHDTGASPDPVLVLTPTHEKGSAAIQWHCTVVQGSTSTLPDECSAAEKQAKSPTADASAPVSASSIGPKK